MSYNRKIEHRFTTVRLDIAADGAVLDAGDVPAPSDDLPEGFNHAQPWDLVSTHVAVQYAGGYNRPHLVAVWRRVIEGIA
jgi:hypothetical protein